MAGEGARDRDAGDPALSSSLPNWPFLNWPLQNWPMLNALRERDPFVSPPRAAQFFIFDLAVPSPRKASAGSVLVGLSTQDTSNIEPSFFAGSVRILPRLGSLDPAP